MVAENKHHIRKKDGSKPSDMGFPGDSSISSKKIITMKTRQSLGHFGTNRDKLKQLQNIHSYEFIALSKYVK